MQDRDRLSILIQSAVDGCARHWAEKIADYLIANGVIVPPCKIGTIDRIIEILKSKHEDSTYTYEEFADYLVSESVIAPPCNIGDKVYFIDTCTTAEDFGKEYISYGKVAGTEISIYEKIRIYFYVLTQPHFKFEYGRFISASDVFMTSAEAEKALERSNDNA